MGKGQRKRQRKRAAKQADEERRANKHLRQERGARGGLPEVGSRPDEQVQLIRAYHTIEKRIAAVAVDSGMQTEHARQLKVAELRAQQEALGGLDAYQKASLAGESSDAYKQFNSSEWVLGELNGKPMASTHVGARRTTPLELPPGKVLQLLDVGAIVNHYPPPPETASSGGGEGDDSPPLRPGAVLGPWVGVGGVQRLHVTSIDLNPRDDAVTKADFFDFAQAKVDARIQYDVVVLSLVMNFVGSPARRGQMLQLCERLIVDGGLLFFVVPEPCIYNSRYLKWKLFSDMVSSCGLPLVDGGYKRTAKLFFSLHRRTDDPAKRIPARSFARKVVRTGRSSAKCNNFCILLGHQGCHDVSVGGSGKGGASASSEGSSNRQVCCPKEAADSRPKKKKNKKKKNNKKNGNFFKAEEAAGAQRCRTVIER